MGERTERPRVSYTAPAVAGAGFFFSYFAEWRIVWDNDWDEAPTGRRTFGGQCLGYGLTSLRKVIYRDRLRWCVFSISVNEKKGANVYRHIHWI